MTAKARSAGTKEHNCLGALRQRFEGRDRSAQVGGLSGNAQKRQPVLGVVLAQSFKVRLRARDPSGQRRLAQAMAADGAIETARDRLLILCRLNFTQTPPHFTSMQIALLIFMLVARADELIAKSSNCLSR